MTASRTEIRDLLFGEFASCLHSEWTAITEIPEDFTLHWRQPFSGVAGAVWIIAPETDRPTYTDRIAPALAGLEQAMTARSASGVTCNGGEEAPSAPADALWASIGNLVVGLEFTLLDAFVEESPPQNSKTFDLLMDVELPVSVSFGRARVPLKDVLKLTTGSIVELNRSLAEPVEVIVNNCVIARGEVVVVEGNFGVRIQQVISRQDRLRTL